MYAGANMRHPYTAFRKRNPLGSLTTQLVSQPVKIHIEQKYIHPLFA
jgi:hypothetical protein